MSKERRSRTSHPPASKKASEPVMQGSRAKTSLLSTPEMPRARPVEFHVRRYKTTEDLLLRPVPRASPAGRGGAGFLCRQLSSGERETPGGKPLASVRKSRNIEY